MMAELAGWFTTPCRAPALKAKLAAPGFSPVGRCRADFAALPASKYDDYGGVFREAHIVAE